MAVEIDWMKIAFVLEHHKIGGWTYIEVPWKVPLAVQRITYPILADTQKEKFVGSSEQSFLWLDSLGQLSPNRYISCSPCHRKESAYDVLHQKTFMKVELYQNVNVNKAALSAMVTEVYNIMSLLLTDSDQLATVKTPEGWDIELNGVEVGSYGIRQHGSLNWIYGTGIAEPRFSTAMMLGKEKGYVDPIF